jgi:hypothetical protein
MLILVYMHILICELPYVKFFSFVRRPGFSIKWEIKHLQFFAAAVERDPRVMKYILRQPGLASSSRSSSESGESLSALFSVADQGRNISGSRV